MIFFHPKEKILAPIFFSSKKKNRIVKKNNPIKKELSIEKGDREIEREETRRVDPLHIERRERRGDIRGEPRDPRDGADWEDP